MSKSFSTFRPPLFSGKKVKENSGDFFSSQRFFPLDSVSRVVIWIFVRGLFDGNEFWIDYNSLPFAGLITLTILQISSFDFFKFQRMTRIICWLKLQITCLIPKIILSLTWEEIGDTEDLGNTKRDEKKKEEDQQSVLLSWVGCNCQVLRLFRPLLNCCCSFYLSFLSFSLSSTYWEKLIWKDKKVGSKSRVDSKRSCWEQWMHKLNENIKIENSVAE